MKNKAEEIRKRLPKPRNTGEWTKRIQGFTFQWIPNPTVKGKGYWRLVNL